MSLPSLQSQTIYLCTLHGCAHHNMINYANICTLVTTIQFCMHNPFNIVTTKYKKEVKYLCKFLQIGYKLCEFMIKPLQICIEQVHLGFL